MVAAGNSNDDVMLPPAQELIRERLK